jgi:amino acid transporter
MVGLDTQNGSAVQRRLMETAPRRSWRTHLIGRPLPTADAPHQTVGKAIGLAIFASDALSSTAYATQEILVVLAIAGTMAFRYAFPLSIAIVVLLIMVTLSYEQTVHAYSNGGGAYIVARDNLGELAARTAGAALLTDYVLTVAVSVSSGVAQIVSAFPMLFRFRVHISAVLVLFVMMMNLRGVKESGKIFALPTYFFVVAMYSTVIIAFIRYLAGNLGVVTNPPPLDVAATAQIAPFLLLHAFSNGTAALTGVEAISNGIPAFKEPKSRNAGITLVWMSAILGSLFLGISFLAVHIGAIPSERETVISQIARTAFGGVGFFYLASIAATTVILVMATNTSFADFPRLSALMAIDGFLPRQLAYRGSRLVYSRGIVALALIACLLIIAFDASVTGLIPLYAIGVFLSFTLSQAGMARRWWKSGHLQPGVSSKEAGSTLRHDHRWFVKMMINSTGSLLTAVVVVVFGITKFAEGAWVVLILIPLLALLLRGIHKHYLSLARSLNLDEFGEPPPIPRHRVILLINQVHRGTLAALRYAQNLSFDVTAVHVSMNRAESENLRGAWPLWGKGTRLLILESPHQAFLEPVLRYIDEISNQRQPNEIITVVVPQLIPEKWISSLLHMPTAMLLRLMFLTKKNIVITDIPYQINGAAG